MSKLLQNWSEVGGQNSGILRQNNTGKQGQITTLALNPIYSPSDQEYIYNYRRNPPVPFVSAYGSEVLKPQPRSGADKKQKVPDQLMNVITQRIPNRLVNCPQLTYPQTLYTLDRSLQAYDVAYQKCGPFRVNDQMIGFNNEGNCKVWVNQNFANNHPSCPRNRLMSTRYNSNQYLQGKVPPYGYSSDQSQMVQEIVGTVENYCQQGRFPQPFATQIHQRNLSFSDARKIIYDTVLDGRIPVPNRVDLFTNRVWMRTTKTSTSTNVVNTNTNVINTNANVTNTITTPINQQYVTTTTVQQPVRGYMFNYLPVPVNRAFQPDIFASRVGEHGVYKGLAY